MPFDSNPPAPPSSEPAAGKGVPPMRQSAGRRWLAVRLERLVAPFLRKGGHRGAEDASPVLRRRAGDDGEIVGIEADRFSSEDQALLHFDNLIKEHVGLEHAGLISVAAHSVDGKRILVVDCEPSMNPMFQRFGEEEEYFVRVASGTRKLPISKTLEHLKQRHATEPQESRCREP